MSASTTIRAGTVPRTALLALLVTGLVAAARSDTATLQPVADTSLFELSPTNNLGTVEALPAGTINKGKRCRLLLRFDVAQAIPAGSIVTGASLRLTVVNSGGADSVFALRRVRQSWGEGAKGGSGNTGEAATDGEATWLARVHPSTLWTEPGGKIGADFSTAVSASVALSGVGTYPVGSTTDLVGDVQAWLDQPAQNHGWVLLSTDEATAGTAKRLASREEPANAPTLVLEYTPPGAPPRIDSITLVGDEVRLGVHVEAGKFCAMQYLEALPGSNWMTLSTVVSKFWPTNWVATDTRLTIPEGRRRFYRLEVWDID